MRSLALKGFGLDQIWAQIEHHTGSVNDKLISQLSALMADEEFLAEIAMNSTDDQEEAASSQENGDDGGDLGAEYGSEEEGSGQEEGYEFEKSGDDKLLDVEQKKGGIFDKNESDSEVEEYLENMEEDEMGLDGLKLPSDAEEEDQDEMAEASDDDDEDDYDDEDGPGLDDYDDEDDFGKGIVDDYGDEGALKKSKK